MVCMSIKLCFVSFSFSLHNQANLIASRRDQGVLAIGLAVAAILVQIIDGERFHPVSPQRPTKPDPIDPTGRGSPGIVIVYKKSGKPYYYAI